jgi:hypothetical protein
MKNLILLCLSAFILSSCLKDSCKDELTYYRYDAVYVTPDEYRVPVTIDNPRELKNPGKIYFYNDFILINEIREGLHIIDNTDPAQPVNRAFISILGNIDMAVADGVLYADAYTDLVSLNVVNINNITELNRRHDVFTSHYHANNNGIVSHYQKTDIVQSLDCSDMNFGRIWWGQVDSWIGLRADNLGTFSNESSFYSVGVNQGVPAVGIGGSMARFTISKNHLYAVGPRELYSFPLTGGGQTGQSVTTGLPWGIETIFPYKDYLFIGANNGMHIMDISSPTSPVHASTFEHAQACDPVVVDGDIAYVTLRDGTECLGFVNQLEVIDVRNIHSPKHLYTHRMSHPHGLSVFGNELYLCEGKHGLKTFDKRDPAKIPQNLLSHIKGFHAYDVIVVPGKSLLVIGNDGFRQYNYSNPGKLELLSTIPVIRT